MSCQAFLTLSGVIRNGRTATPCIPCAKAVGNTFLIMLYEPFTSALMTNPRLDLYNPLLILRPLNLTSPFSFRKWG